MTLSSFHANFIVRVLTLKGLETDTLYLVFKHRFQIVSLDCLTDDLNSPQANGDISQPIQVCQVEAPILGSYFRRTKAPHSPANSPEKSGTRFGALVYVPRQPLHLRGMRIIGI